MPKHLTSLLIVFCSVLFANFLLMRACSEILAADVSARRPNIVFILADDLGWADLGCYGSTFYETPHLDRLARQSMRFTSAYAACNVCSPTRASIMTGKYPARLQLTNFLVGLREGENSPVLTAKYRHELPLEEVTLAERLRDGGYATGHFGKWHLGGAEFSPEQQGFQFVQLSSGPGNPEAQDKIVDAAVSFLDEHAKSPFFLYLALDDPHIPLRAKSEYLSHFEQKPSGSGEQQNAVYAAVLKNMDRNVGHVLDKIDALNLQDHTYVIFTSDNGGLAVEEGPNTPATSNAPLRGSKGHNYEGGIRVPLLARGPTIKPGSTCDVPVVSTDHFKTVLDLAQVDAVEGDAPDGRNLCPLLQGQGNLARRPLYWHYPHFSNQGGRPSGAVRDEKWKLIEFYEDGRLELYDLEADPSEQSNLADKSPDKSQELQAKLAEWRSTVNANMPEPNPNYSTSAK